ncbi:MAG: phosphate signaling complex protein PhoU [Bradyrhizobiaceae bacterium]|nr:phosphate signaling complex protein PhoU [Bradyrhizobiaceae bacterium]
MIKHFEEDLDKLRTRLIRMGSLVEEQVEFAFKALADGNEELARIVMERDDKVDKLDLKIDKLCQRIFALNQPVASDLRLLLTAIKINNELERIGDIATEIARVVPEAPGATHVAREIDITQMTSAVFTLFQSSVDSFINNDPDLASHILPTDSTIDDQYLHLRTKLIGYMTSHTETIADSARLLLVLQQMKRLADHATNIAENVIFLVEAKLVRHRGLNSDAEPT